MTTTVESLDARIALVRFDEGKGNALSYNAIAALARALSDAHSRADAVVLTGAGKVFCAGLDLRLCAKFDRASMRTYIDAFETLFEAVFTFEKPLVAALNGHAIAGGAVIALACDARAMTPSSTIGLNEVLLGLPFPSMALEIGRFGFPPIEHTDALLLGKTYSAQEALGVKVARVVDEDAVRGAKSIAQSMLHVSTSAFADVKKSLRADSLLRARANIKSSRAMFLDAFFGDDAQKRIGDVVAKLERK